MNYPTSLLRPTSITGILLAVLLSLSSTSALAGDRYQVEILVFKQNGVDGGEQWPLQAGFPDLEKAIAYDGNSKAIKPLSRDTWQLSGIEKALDRQGARQPVFHAAWEQVIVGGRKSPEVHIVSPDGRMDGIVRIDRGRYLHLYLDLTSDGVRMQQKRRMRSKQIHHFDHPRMGVIALVTPVEKG